MGSGCKFCVGGMNVNCVGIDVSKGKSMIAVMRPLGEMVIPPFEVGHTDAELCELSRRLGGLEGETRVVTEATGNYHLPVASFLYDSGFYVSVVKTDKKDAVKLANYGLDHWLTLPRYIRRRGTAYAENHLPAIPAMHQSTDHAQKQLNLLA